MKLGLTEEQRVERRKGIGGSDANAIMKGEWRRLWREKTGRAAEEDLSDNLAVQMGSATEDFNAYWFEKVTGRKVDLRNTTHVAAHAPWMRANFDGVTTTSKGRWAYWDAKHIGGRVDDAALRYTPQMTHCAYLCVFDWWVLSIFVGNSKHEIVEQEVDPLYLEELLAKEREFWGYVERDEEPPDLVAATAPPKPTPTLRRFDLQDSSRAAWPNWAPDMISLFRDFAGTHAAAAKHTIVREEIKALLPEDVGFVRYGLVKVEKNKAGAVTIALDKDRILPGEMG